MNFWFERCYTGPPVVISGTLIGMRTLFGYQKRLSTDLE